MIHWRKKLPELSNGATTFYALGNPHILAFSRQDQFLLLGNFSDHAQTVTPSHFAHFLIGAKQRDLLTNDTFDNQVTLEPWQVRWIKRFV
jgi:hypothetical protein